MELREGGKHGKSPQFDAAQLHQRPGNNPKSTAEAENVSQSSDFLFYHNASTWGPPKSVLFEATELDEIASSSLYTKHAMASSPEADGAAPTPFFVRRAALHET